MDEKSSDLSAIELTAERKEKSGVHDGPVFSCIMVYFASLTS
jgi:hypothetical protein